MHAEQHQPQNAATVDSRNAQLSHPSILNRNTSSPCPLSIGLPSPSQSALSRYVTLPSQSTMMIVCRCVPYNPTSKPTSPRAGGPGLSPSRKLSAALRSSSVASRPSPFPFPSVAAAAADLGPFSTASRIARRWPSSPIAGMKMDRLRSPTQSARFAPGGRGGSVSVSSTPNSRRASASSSAPAATASRTTSPTSRLPLSTLGHASGSSYTVLLSP
ncbi:hypothetical protein C8035_v008817 [Colletotrichum spinosum]|uniref:Uncharacterized protein n=1 Tax=Colletotrichum spinosum TaxID=1347390 RepID=A0A4R8QMF4_9PEZI|nr:hypothetical protein C8035_v008817 [Colletotrichum spinosum]